MHVEGLSIFCKTLNDLYFCAVLKFTFLLILIKDIETIYLNHVNGTQFRGFFSSLIFHQLLTHT